MYQNLKKKTEGFTIIEVLIVLAIAGLIMMIVFFAIPALQRNSRNNARNSDASRLASAMQECLSNRNNQTGSCPAADIETLAGTRSQLTGGFTLGGGTGSPTAAVGQYGRKCNAAGTDSSGPNPGNTDYVVRFQLETSTGTMNRCVGSV